MFNVEKHQEENLRDAIGEGLFAMMETAAGRNIIRRWWNETYGTDLEMETRSQARREK